MTLKDKEVSRQKQLWFSLIFVAVMGVSTFVLMYLGIDVTAGTGIIVTIVSALLALSGVNLATTPKGSE